MYIQRTYSHALVEDRLPDGSRFLIDSENEKVFALNAIAGAVWDACGDPVTIAEVTGKMQESFDPGITEDAARQAILALREQNLISVLEASAPVSRRRLMATLGAVALPLVVCLTMTEQRAHAALAVSGKPTWRDRDGQEPSLPPLHWRG